MTTAGDNTVNAGFVADNIFGGNGTDRLTLDCSGAWNGLTATSLNLRLENDGRYYQENIYLSDGSSRTVYIDQFETFSVRGSVGGDSITTGAGDDTIYGGAGDDYLYGGAGMT